MSVDSKLTRARLENVSRAKDKIRRLTWLMAIGAVAVLALISFATMDYWLMLPLRLRYTAFAILAAVTGLGVWGLRQLFQRPTSLKEAALDTESQRNEKDCVVSTAAEYASGKVQAVNDYEPELAAALQTKAAERLQQAHPPYQRRLWRPLSVLGTALAAAAIFVAVTPGAWTALKRIALPWMRAQYTEVEVKPGNIEVRVGRSVEISSAFFGRPPRYPRLQWQAGDNPSWQIASLKKSRDGAFVHPIENVTVPVKYRVSGGDAVSPEFQVTPYLPPEVKYLSVGLNYPEYTKLKPLTQTSPDITILRGSTATIHLRGNVSLSRACVRFSDTNAPRVELRRGENELWTASLKIERDTEYFIELFDRKGRKGEDDTPHRIIATADNLPKVEILEPGQDLRADATNRISVKVSAADDYGVSEIRLVLHKLNSAEQAVICQTESAKNGEWIAIGEIDLATLGLKRYDVVAYHAEARDNNTLDGPGIGRSPLYFIEITDKQSSPAPLLPPVPGEQINLVVVQKQIVADTAALDSSSSTTNYAELALRQTSAMELGRLYLTNMAGALPEAVAEMKSAIASMERAMAPLNKHDRVAALPPEEAALAHLYRVLALLPDVKLLAVTPKPQLPQEKKPQTAVALREIKKPAPEQPQTDPEIEAALEEAKELSRVQAELNQTGQKLALAQSRGENNVPNQSEKQNPATQANGQVEGKGKGEGDGQGQGEGEGKGPGEGKGEGQEGKSLPEKQGTEQQFAKAVATNSLNFRQSLAQTPKSGSTNGAVQQTAESKTTNSPENTSKQAQLAKNPLMANGAKQTTQLTQAQNAGGEGTKPGKGRGKGKGKAKAAGAKGKGKGQGSKPADGSGQPSTQQSEEPPEMAAEDQPENEPQTLEELAQEQEELGAEAKAFGEMLQRLAGKGTRVGHNLALSANKAAEHMEGAAAALKQGNASGAGRRGAMSSVELGHLVTELERVLGKRPDLADVASEEAPKEYEAFISEYFKKLSYEK